MQKKKGMFGWVFTFAGQKKSGYTASVIFAIIGVTFQILPFFVMAKTSLDKGTQRKTTENELPSLTQCTA